MRKSALQVPVRDLELLFEIDRPRLHQRLAIELVKYNALLANVAEEILSAPELLVHLAARVNNE
ncbi:hypothetical protein D3C87_2148420 [compost metagenome]